jgi:FkbM family methyltransferase
MAAGFKLKLDLNEPAQRLIYFFGNYDERHELAMLQQVLRPGDIFWDIGANIGFYTLTASALVGEKGRVLAFEPGPESWSALLANLQLNGTSNVRPFKMAVSESDGWVTLYSQPGLADGGASLIPRPGASLRADVCPAISLDRLYRDQGLKTPTFLKIDVEGAEARVLRWSRELLSSAQPPLVLMEMNDPHEVGALLQDLGFAGAHLRRGRWRLPAICSGSIPDVSGT